MNNPQDANRLRRQLKAFLAQAQQNERKLQRFQQQEVAFMAAAGLGELLDTLFTDYPCRFELDAVTLRLVDPDHEIRRILTELERLPDPRLQFVEVHLPADSRPWLGPLSATEAREHFPDQPPPASAALLPLRRQPRCLGQLAIGSQRRERFITGSATDFMERLADVLAVCIENALNHERIKRLGLVDPLTGLNNRRYFDARLSEEIGQARRTGRPLACLFLDIDHFKQVNDTHGHGVGDRVLQIVATTLKSQMRLNDVLARLGGEEFAVLLADTDQATALDIAERIRLAVAHGSRDALPFPVTISIGCSTLADEETSTPDIAGARLLDEADRALYQAKQTGRNRVALHRAPTAS